MTAGWRISQSESRRRHLEKFDAREAASYDSLVGTLAPDDLRAYRDDLQESFPFRAAMTVLDAGAGTGALTEALASIDGLDLIALEPAPGMLARLRTRPALQRVATVQGFCDHVDDRPLFPTARFDAICSRQLANGLYDPLAAFGNWREWLKPGGAVVLIDGLYGRDAWTGAWAEEVDVLPLAATQTASTVAYLLEVAGFVVETVRPMSRVNALPTTRTKRYVVVARRGT